MECTVCKKNIYNDKHVRIVNGKLYHDDCYIKLVLPYDCPKCKGSKQEKYNAYPKGLPDSDWGEDWQYRKCSFCNGLGRVEYQYMEIDGQFVPTHKIKKAN